MAEALFEQALIANNKADCKVGSAGLGALVGQQADPLACELMLEKGMDINEHRAKQLDRSMIRAADLILVMEVEQKQAIEESLPSARGKVFRLGEWDDFDIPDPYHKGKNAFSTALTLIEQGVMQWIKRL